jgi:hypothetical protein
MTDFLAWAMATSYGPYIVAFFTVMGGLMTIASAIVPLTKTPKDDIFLGKVKGFFDRFSLFDAKPR